MNDNKKIKIDAMGIKELVKSNKYSLRVNKGLNVFQK